MSASKYADLPDIDTAPDIYETEDVIPQSQAADGESSDDEHGIQTRLGKVAREGASREELDYSNVMNTEQATRKFRKAEADQRRARNKSLYEYPASSDSISPVDGTDAPRSVPLSHRLRALQIELLSLENELADPANPLLQKEREAENVDAGELIRGLVDVRSRLDKIKKGKEGRAKLLEQVLETDSVHAHDAPSKSSEKATPILGDAKVTPKSEVETMVDLDRRVRELESLVGSSGTALDEASTLPPPLLPSITRLSNQLTILTQPRHIDSISRRLKLLLSDLERTSTVQNQHRRNASQSNGAVQNPVLQEQLLPLLQRLGPLLPHIPHILTRLRTLAALHSSATDFQSTLEDLEEDQKKTRSGLLELDKAVRTVEDSLNRNRDVVKTNISGLESRVNSLVARLEDLQIQNSISSAS
ncbi:hypothetical protein D9619_001394 [Psilocybe cf. subviscida]|uniref:Dynactin subunit 2 n=1 Tax=Psilocybe cf. subviscida TaxID=2480587 RepID=A0A8H5BD66_9AGAR|nr:hypothetical protein D9619_001394 [Psilocybe cf. subviscida]